MKKNKDLFNSIIIMIVMLIICYFHYYNIDLKILLDNKNKEMELSNKKEEYESCLIEKYSINDNTCLTELYKDRLIQFINKYNISLYYLDSITNYSFKYNENKTYYAASTIKMLDALYIYNKALNNELDLDEEIKYKKNNYMGESKKMKYYKYGDKIKIKDLVNYAVTYSDNIAHNMLVEYIGYNNLKEYGKFLGAKYTLNTDIFGEINVDDSIVYLKELNHFINDNNIYSDELKQMFLDSEQNYLSIPELSISAAIKYGEYGSYYHENGIVYDKNPYLISILSTIGNNEKVFREINNKVYELHKIFYQEREKRCYSKIYE